jgi:TolA-binding protein
VYYIYINVNFYPIERKTMRIIIILFLLVSATSVHAEVYKCYTLKKVSYQPAPCSGVSDSQDVINVLKQSPQQKEEAQGRMNAMRAEQMEKQQAIQSQMDNAAEQQKNAAVQQQLDDAQHAVAEAKQNADRAIRDAESAKQSADNARHAAETTSYNHDHEPQSVITNSVTKSYGRAN